MKNIKKSIVKSKNGVEYEVSQKKAEELINKFGCTWIGGEKVKEDKKQPKDENSEGNEDIEQPKRGRKPINK